MGEGLDTLGDHRFLRRLHPRSVSTEWYHHTLRLGAVNQVATRSGSVACEPNRSFGVVGSFVVLLFIFSHQGIQANHDVAGSPSWFQFD